MALDTFGRPVNECYSIIADHTFERRLKNFDPNLKLMFDQQQKRFFILEWAYDNSGWNIILKAEDENGNPKPLGDWVFNRLFVYRERYMNKVNKGADVWLNDLCKEAMDNNRKEDEKIRTEGTLEVLDDINEYRRGARELLNQPTSDVTAGYPKH